MSTLAIRSYGNGLSVSSIRVRPLPPTPLLSPHALATASAITPTTRPKFICASNRPAETSHSYTFAPGETSHVLSALGFRRPRAESREPRADSRELLVSRI